MLFDTHCHLQDPRFESQRKVVLMRARAAGVHGFLCCATQENDWDSVLDLAVEEIDVLPALGLHPWFAREAQPGWLARLVAHLANPKVAIGECGLDFAVADLDREAQIQAFRQQLRLARRFERPLSIHCRKAWEALLTLLREEGPLTAGAAVHAYSGSAEVARELQAKGVCLGFGCGLLNPVGTRAIKALKALDDDHFLLETDSPDLPPWGPEYAEGKPNELANLVRVAEAAAVIRGVDANTLRTQAWANAVRCFGDPG